MVAWIPLGYLGATALFILGLKKLGHPRTAPRGNQYGALGMLLAYVIICLIDVRQFPERACPAGCRTRPARGR